MDVTELVDSSGFKKSTEDKYARRSPSNPLDHLQPIAFSADLTTASNIPPKCDYLGRLTCQLTYPSVCTERIDGRNSFKVKSSLVPIPIFDKFRVTISPSEDRYIYWSIWRNRSMDR